MLPQKLITLHPQTSPSASSILEFDHQQYKCAIGRSGIIDNKKEGDGGTPSGTYYLEEVYYRADRIPAPVTQLPLHKISPDMGWCDDVNSSCYNTLVKLPFKASHEKLSREDNIYDIIVVISHNRHPPIKGLGSAIFIHLARPDYSPTAGCIALSKQDLLTLLQKADINTGIYIPRFR